MNRAILGVNFTRKGKLATAIVSATTLMAVLGSSIAIAYPSAHAPFAPGEEPKHGQLENCVILPPADGVDLTDHPSRPRLYSISESGTAATVQVRELETFDFEIGVLDRDGKPLATPYTSKYVCYYEQVLTADLNQDGLADFVVLLCNAGGTGLASFVTESVILLSEEGRYLIHAFGGYEGGSMDFIRMKKGGPWFFISTDLVGSREIDPENTNHNFWLYRLYRFENARMVETSETHHFPKFIWYTARNNHAETTRLTADEKARLLEINRSENDGRHVE